jgi:arylsulfatase A-like enzyme
MVVSVPPRWARLATAPMGTGVEAPISLVDLAPTLLSIAGLEAPPEMQGAAFLGQRIAPPRTYAFGMRNRMACRRC